jgi:hypothetical protein
MTRITYVYFRTTTRRSAIWGEYPQVRLPDLANDLLGGLFQTDTYPHEDGQFYVRRVLEVFFNRTNLPTWTWHVLLHEAGWYTR